MGDVLGRYPSVQKSNPQTTYVLFSLAGEFAKHLTDQKTCDNFAALDSYGG
jgi:hypothetical protein